jgi:threonine dehydrogenase-like Zn-dependent dehydrogenase
MTANNITTNARTMRYRNDGSIELYEQWVDDPGPGEVQLQGGACGICSWDIATVRWGNKVPMAPAGHEGVGYVAKVGPGVTGLKEGDRVAGGGFASVRNLPAAHVYKIPDSPLADEFWVVEPVSCAVTGLDHCRLRAGDRIAVIGSGFMGLLILQGLLHAPLDQVIAIDVVQSRLDLARTIGVTETFNASQADRAQLAAELRQREFDVVVDTTGNQAGLDLATDIVKRGGLINLFGWLKGESATFDPTKWHGGGFTIVNSSPSSKLRDPFPPAIRLIHRGVFDLRPLVTHLAPLDGYAALMDRILSGDSGYVKGVVTLS